MALVEAQERLVGRREVAFVAHLVRVAPREPGRLQVGLDVFPGGHRRAETRVQLVGVPRTPCVASHHIVYNSLLFRMAR